jgi:hypothetical protein
MAGHYGQRAKLAFAPQSTISVFPAAAGFRPCRFYAAPAEVKADFQPDPVIGGSVQNDFDTPELIQDMAMVDGAFDFPLCVNQSGDIFSWIFGVPTTTGASAPFTHSFISGVPSAPRMYAAERFLTAARQRRLFGLVPKSLGMEFAKENGIQRMSVGVIGRDEVNNATPLTLVLNERAYAPLARKRAVISVGGSAAPEAVGLSFDYQTGVKDIPYLDGTDAISAIERDDDSTFSGTLKVRTDSNLYHALGDGGTMSSVGVVTGSGNAIFQASANVRFGRRGVPVTGRGGMVSEFPFQGQVLAAAPMLTIALVNALPNNTYV